MILHEETAVTFPGDITLPTVPVLSSTMAYREIGGPEGASVAIFLHGSPTSSYIWRNIMPLVAPVARCVAPDRIGFGQSGKPNIDYSFFDQVRYLDAFLEAAGITSAYLVLQDWGTGLGFHLAARRPDFVKGIAFMEFLRPFKDWEDFSGTPEVRAALQGFRTPGVGEEMILDRNMFVEGLLPHGTASPITPEAMAVYRAPFDPGSAPSYPGVPAGRSRSAASRRTSTRPSRGRTPQCAPPTTRNCSSPPCRVRSPRRPLRPSS
jgi:haloalkane dehalogenase